MLLKACIECLLFCVRNGNRFIALLINPSSGPIVISWLE
ncbi:hypothetical protein AHF37_10366 [Paragonimus kellicotti]|nr:hypothetical protein AHF37_10366 [Paragonimus kellicotti]